MHPVIRVSCFLLFCIALVRPNEAQLLFAALLIIALFPLLSVSCLRRTFSMVRRLRWLLLSVLVIYGWFSPGAPIELPLPEFLWPSRTGLEAGLFRVATLILILLAAGILLVTTSREKLIAALYWLLSPLRRLRLAPDKLAVRLTLTLEYVEQQEALWRTPPATGAEGMRGRINRIARHLAGLLPKLFEQAERQPVRPVSLDVPPGPALIQWGWPLLLVAGFVAGALIQL